MVSSSGVECVVIIIIRGSELETKDKVAEFSVVKLKKKMLKGVFCSSDPVDLTWVVIRLAFNVESQVS